MTLRLISNGPTYQMENCGLMNDALSGKVREDIFFVGLVPPPPHPVESVERLIPGVLMNFDIYPDETILAP